MPLALEQRQRDGIIASLTELNTVPASGGWTAGQPAEHILLSNASVTMQLTATGAIAERKADERVAEFKELFLSYTHKFDAAHFFAANAAPPSRSCIKTIEGIILHHYRNGSANITK